MYVIDFLTRMIRKSNISLLIYLVFNVLIIGFMVGLSCNMTYLQGFLWGIILYMVSLAIALSPLGEWILRLQTGCRKINRTEQINFLEPIFREVYSKAKKLDPSISDDIQLYMSSDEQPNAFATGRKTICVTRGLLNMPAAQIKATLAHEFGHLAHKDTDLILVVSIGNFFVTGFIMAIRAAIELFHWFVGLCATVLAIFFYSKAGILTQICNIIYRNLLTVFVSGLTWAWSRIGILLVMKSSRSNEFEADEFSFNCGYGNDLCIMLDTISGDGVTGLFANLVSGHPNKDDRIAKLQGLGATYRVSYNTK